MASRVIFSVYLCLLVAVWPPLSHGSEPWPDDIGRIKQRGKLIVAQFRGARSGFFFYDDKGRYANLPSCSYNGRRLVGCDIALASQIARSLGVELELDRSAGDFDSVCRNVALGKADVGISKLSITAKRAQYVRFTIPYTILTTGVLVDRLHLAGTKSRKDALELCSREDTSIGVLGRSAYLEFARIAFPCNRLVPYSDLDSMVKGVLGGEIHVLYGEQLLLMGKLHRDPKLALRLRFVPVPRIEDHIAIAVSPRSPNLLAFLNVLLRLNHTREQTAQMLRSLLPAELAQSDATGKTDMGKGLARPPERQKEQP